MFDWLKSLTDVLYLDAPKAWVATIIGVVALIFIRMQWWPLGTGEVITGPVAGFLALYGLANLLVRCGAWMKGNIDYANEQEARQRNDAEYAVRVVEEIKANLTTLDGVETAQLRWILERPNRRIEQDIRGSLVNKHILVLVQRGNYHLADVHPWVWENRNDILGGLSAHRSNSPLFPSNEYGVRHG